MPTFLVTWKAFDPVRSDTFTLFGSMDEAADRNDQGEGVTQFGRWFDLGFGSGWGIWDAADAKTLYKFIYNWSEAAVDVKVQPVLDDDAARNLLLAKAGKDPATWSADYYTPMAEAGEGESLYAIPYKFYESKKAAGFALFSGLTQAEDKGDCGACRPIGRWHNLADGSGFAVAAAKNTEDLMGWALNWAEMVEVQIIPCLTDKETRDIIQGKPGFAQKLKAVQVKMGI